MITKTSVVGVLAFSGVALLAGGCGLAEAILTGDFCGFLVEATPCGCVDCSDGLYCNGIESCSAVRAEAVCWPGDPLDCPDGLVCDEDELRRLVREWEAATPRGVWSSDINRFTDACVEPSSTP